MIQTTAPTPTNPHVYRLGKVERRFQEFAETAEMKPGQLLEKLLGEGVTQTQLASELSCTRQAVGVLASRYGLEFPGAKLDLDEAAKASSGAKNFKDYVKKFWGDLTQKQMADQLGASLSTIKRRIKDLKI